MAGFLSLSLEIREMIYEFALVVDGYIDPYGDYVEREYLPLPEHQGKIPGIGLLQVCRFINSEAVPIFYSKNVWCVGNNSAISHGMVNIWSLRSNLFRVIYLSFSGFDEDSNNEHQVDTVRARTLHDASGGDAHSWFADSWFADSWFPDQEMIHEGELELFNLHWQWKFEVLEKLTQLKLVVVDIGQLYCQMGCCREEMIEILFDNFLVPWKEGLQAKFDCYSLCRKWDLLRVKIINLGGKDEQEQMENEWGFVNTEINYDNDVSC